MLSKNSIVFDNIPETSIHIQDLEDGGCKEEKLRRDLDLLLKCWNKEKTSRTSNEALDLAISEILNDVSGLKYNNQKFNKKI